MAKDSNWSGYTLDELRVRRMVALAKIEVQKSNMAKQVNSATRFTGFGGPLLSKVTGALNYMDYAFLAFRVGRSIYKLIRR